MENSILEQYCKKQLSKAKKGDVKILQEIPNQSPKMTEILTELFDKARE